MGLKREPDPDGCEKHGRPKCYDCLREHHLAEATLLLELLEEHGCRCDPSAGHVCVLHTKYPYLFKPST
jgi:hypothetical protein